MASVSPSCDARCALCFVYSMDKVIIMDCLRCGACCKWIILKGEPKGENRKLWEMRNAVLIDGFILVQVKCSRLKESTGLCTVYDRRLQMCKDFVKGSEECLLCRKASELLD